MTFAPKADAIARLRAVVRAERPPETFYRIPLRELRVIARYIAETEDQMRVWEEAAMTMDRELEAQLDEVSLELEILKGQSEDALAIVHPNYGPCDDLFPDGRCSECVRIRGERINHRATRRTAR